MSRTPAAGGNPLTAVRVDRWLWAARFFKTRAQAKAAIEGGKVEVQGQRAKASREVRRGDRLVIAKGGVAYVVDVTELATQRGSATATATLYQETPDSIEARERERALRRMQREGLRIPEQRPTRQGRRALQDLKRNDGAADG